MSGMSNTNPAAIGGKGLSFARISLYAILALFCLYYLLPLYVMVVNSPSLTVTVKCSLAGASETIS